MKHFVLGTAGHIDHGKSSLVLALTGIDPDRLKEEKARGITIELGFAPLDLPDGRRLGIVDVPGHEKFVKTMVAGATGVDLVLLVIAADEGVMPQTREHLDICRMLGVRQGLVVLSKVDLVDEDWIALVREDLKTFLAGTFLEDAPVLEFSAKDNRGLETIKQVIGDVEIQIEGRPAGDLFRLPVDRVFTMKGFGTVVTGTTVEGSISVGDEVEILPSGRLAKVRGIHVHQEPAQTLEAGNRTAVNLQGVTVEEVHRGDVVAHVGQLTSTYIVDTRLSYLSSATNPLKTRQRVRFHVGTSEILARAIPLESPEMPPGGDGFVQLRLEQPTVCRAGDRFVVRSYSPVLTIGGGVIVNPFAGKHKQPFTQAIATLEQLAASEPQTKALALYNSAGRQGISSKELRSFLRLSEKRTKELAGGLLAKKDIVRFEKDSGRAVSIAVVDELSATLLGLVTEYHARQAKRPGIPKAELEQKAGRGYSPTLVAYALNELIQNQKIVQEEELLWLPTHKVILASEEREIEQKILADYAQAKLSAPTVRELIERYADKKVEVPQILERLHSQGKLVSINQTLYLEAGVLVELKESLKKYFGENEQLDAQAFKGLTGLSRKFAIPILEYLDRDKFTIRVNDARILRTKLKPGG